MVGVVGSSPIAPTKVFLNVARLRTQKPRIFSLLACFPLDWLARQVYGHAEGFAVQVDGIDSLQ